MRPESETGKPNPGSPNYTGVETSTPESFQQSENSFGPNSLDPIVDLANEYLERYRAGESPQLDEYMHRYPDLAEQIEEVFPMMLLMEDNAPSGNAADADGSQPIGPDSQIDRLGDFKIRRVIGRGGMGIVYEAMQESLGRQVALKVCPATMQMSPRNRERFRRESRAAAMLHHTNIVPVFAVGEEDGMLFYAMQFIRGASLDEVIRELRVLWQSSPTATTKLAASASMNRPSNASQVAQSVFGDDRSTSTSMGHIANQSDQPIPPQKDSQASARSVSSLPGEVSLPGIASANPKSENSTRIGKYWESVAKIGIQVANALGYAHAQGTLHRDIKPANLMLDQAGVVWVMDFGLAKSTEEDDLTREGELIGTLRYMAPEQCAGNSEQRSDVYSLGLTLYELLALQPAFKDLHRSQLLLAIAEEDPVPPRKINANVPKDLETIVLKAIEKDPARRYASPTEMERDLQRFLAGEPIQARPVTHLERVHKWIRRRPLVSGLATALVTLFILSFGLVAWSWLRAEEALVESRAKTQIAISAQEVAGSNQLLAEERLEIAQSALYRGAINRARMLSQSNMQEAERLLAEMIPEDGERDRRGWEWGYLQALVHQHVAKFEVAAPQAEWIWDLNFSPDDSLLAVATGRPEFVNPVGVSPRGRATIWNPRTAERVCELPIEHSAYSIAISHDNRKVAICEVVALDHFEMRWTGYVQVWDIASKKVLSRLELPESQRAYRLRFSPDDRLLVGTAWQKSDIQHLRTAAWNVETGEEIWTRSLTSLTHFADDPEQLQVVHSYFDENANSDRYPNRARIETLNFATGERIGEPTESAPCSAFYVPDADCIIDTVDGDLVLMNTAGRLLKRLTGGGNHFINQKNYFQPVCSVHNALGLVATGSTDGSICLWSLDSDRPLRILHGHPERIQSLTHSHDGTWLASGDWGGQVRIWKPNSRPEHTLCDTPTGYSATPSTEALAFRWDGSGIVAYQDSRIEVYEAESGELLKLHWIEGAKQLVSQREACFDESGSQLAVLQKDKSIAMYSVESGNRWAKTESIEELPTCVAMSGDGSTMGVCCPAGSDSEDSVLYVWKITPKDQGIEQLHREFISGQLNELAFNGDGSLLAVGLHAQASDELLFLKTTDLESCVFKLPIDFGEQMPPHKTGVSALAFSRDSQHVAYASHNGEAGVLVNREPNDLTGWELLASMNTPSNIEQLSWHPDGNRLAGANRDDAIVWNLQGEEVLTLARGPRPNDYQFDGCVCFSPDGRKLAANRHDNNISVWSTLRNPDNLAQQKRRLRMEERALESISKAIEKSPLDPWYLSVRGRITAGERSKAEVLQDYREAKNLVCGEPCLFLQGNAFVVAPSIPFDEFEGHTIEAWVKRWSQSPVSSESPIASQFRGLQSESYADRREAQVQANSGIRLPSPTVATPEAWTHIAICNDGKDERYFVNGTLHSSRELKNNNEAKKSKGQLFYVGSSAYNSAWLPKGEGLIRSLRVSSQALYDREFTPPESFEGNESCELLFDFTSSQGLAESTIRDQSGKGRDGLLRDAWWLPSTEQLQ